MKMKMKMKMKMLVTLLYVSQHALGVEVYEGAESVLLPCQVSVSVSKDSTVVWIREEFSAPVVHLRDQRGDDLRDQNRLYINRTSMRTDALQTGDLGLTLRRPTIRDSSTYTCIIRKLGRDQSREEVQLRVREPPPPVWPKVLAGFMALVAVAAAAAAGFIKYKRMKNREVKQVEVEEGEESVQLPFKTIAHLSEDVRVEWTDHHNNKVHVYQNGSDRPEEQDQVYRDRTEMKEDPLRTGDLSLTLKHLTVRDSGYYTCRVYKDGDLLRWTRVILWVKGQEVEVKEGEESVQLPFKTTAHLSEDVRVEWTDRDRRKVHVYQNGSDRPEEQNQVYRDRTEMKDDPLRTGDLSLTLKHLTIRDSGYYTCRVYKDGDLLRGTAVNLWVKGRNQDIRNRSNNAESTGLMDVPAV